MIYFLFNCLSQLKGANAEELGPNIRNHIFSSVNTSIADTSEGRVGVLLRAVPLQFKWSKQAINDWEQAHTLCPHPCFGAFPFCHLASCTLGRHYFRVVYTIYFAGICFHLKNP